MAMFDIQEQRMIGFYLYPLVINYSVLVITNKAKLWIERPSYELYGLVVN